MNEIETEPLTAESNGTGYQVSAEPVVQTRRAVSAKEARANFPAEVVGALADTSLAVLARDPKTLFVFWDQEVSQQLTAIGLDPERFLLRAVREDGSEEKASAIDPLLGYAFAEVGTAGASYTCELGFLQDSTWQRLVGSGAVKTPPDGISENEDAEFATVPFHLSFQRLIDIFRASSNSQKTLSESIATMQDKARELRAEMSPEEWSHMITTATSSVAAEVGLDSSVQSNELSALLQTVKEDVRRELPSPETRARWRYSGENFGGSSGGASWGGESSR